MNVFEELKKRLSENGIEFKVMEHEPVYTSEQAAKVRGVPIESGAKAMVMRSKGKFYMFVLSSAKRLDMKKIKEILGTKSLSLATPEEVLENCHCEVGAVPPFGDLFGMEVFVDESIPEQETINFNAGRHEKSIQMKSRDYLKVVKHKLSNFSK
jgi:Ala-tRNA(Pro) deacylase